MGLSEFIQANQEAILGAFEAYVLAHVPPGVDLTRGEARDQAAEVLADIAEEMRQRSLPQGDQPAEKHGNARLAAGFGIKHILGEYRMLRGTIMRMWLASRPPLGTAGVEDLVRFNEAIDQAVHSSVSQFEADGSRVGARKLASASRPAAVGRRPTTRPSAGKRKRPK